MEGAGSSLRSGRRCDGSSRRAAVPSAAGAASSCTASARISFPEHLTGTCSHPLAAHLTRNHVCRTRCNSYAKISCSGTRKPGTTFLPLRIPSPARTVMSDGELVDGNRTLAEVGDHHHLRARVQPVEDLLLDLRVVLFDIPGHTPGEASSPPVRPGSPPASSTAAHPARSRT